MMAYIGLIVIWLYRIVFKQQEKPYKAGLQYESKELELENQKFLFANKEK